MRGEFGFEGYVCSDFGAVAGLGPGNHAVAANDTECVRLFLEAGGSMSGHDFGADYEKHALELVRSGRMAQATLDTAAAAVLAVKARLGLVPAAHAHDGVAAADAPSPLTPLTLVQTNLADNPKHVAAAARAARESCVLLSNANATLPLSKAKVKRLLVLGPNADEVRTGDYSAAGWAGGAPNGGGNIDNNNSVTILEGLKLQFPAADVTHIVGTGITGKGKTCGQGPCLGGGEGGASANLPFWTAVQRHSLSLSAAFSPTAPSSPYKPDAAAPTSLPAGAQGLRASYFNGTALAGEAVLTRLDFAPNFHFFALGPDPFRCASTPPAARRPPQSSRPGWCRRMASRPVPPAPHCTVTRSLLLVAACAPARSPCAGRGRWCRTPPSAGPPARVARSSPSASASRASPTRRRVAWAAGCSWTERRSSTPGRPASLVLGESVIKCPSPLRTCSKIHTIIADIEHVQMNRST
jgi:hypothetical protein